MAPVPESKADSSAFDLLGLKNLAEVVAKNIHAETNSATFHQSSFHHKLEIRESESALIDIESILERPESEISFRLKEYLRNRWDKIKGTYISYTSVPEYFTQKQEII